MLMVQLLTKEKVSIIFGKVLCNYVKYDIIIIIIVIDKTLNKLTYRVLIL